MIARIMTCTVPICRALTAHGITDALRDAELLADAIDAGSDAALAEYQEQRDAASLELFETTEYVVERS